MHCLGLPDKYTYRRFLRARQHDIPRAMEMWVKHLKVRSSHCLTFLQC